MRTKITKRFRRPSFLTGTITLFILLFLFHCQSTFLMENVDLQFSLLSTFCYSYVALLLFYFLFRLYEIYFLEQPETDFEVLEQLEKILDKLKWIFGGLICIQVAFHLYYGYQAVLDQPDATFIHFVASELLNLFRAGSEWIRYHIEIVIRVNNLCILGYCANEYPIVPYILAGGAFYVLRKLLKNRLTRAILLLGYRYGLKVLVLCFNVSLKVLKGFTIGLFRFLWFVKSKIFFRKRVVVKENKVNVPLTLNLLDHAIATVWSELCLIDSWIEKIHLRFFEESKS